MGRKGSNPFPGTTKGKMGGIRVLSDEVVNLIAAGEVVERPASVVKELVENSLDAGASAVSVEALEGGRRMIVVRDDGSGMSRQDLLMSVRRHATSKLTQASELHEVATLGFRGEALPSIAAVSHMRIVSSEGGEAWALEMDGGILKGIEPASRTRGTTVEVAGLFFNQPARRRFLRSVETEAAWMARHLTGLALARPDVRMDYSHNGSRVFSIAPGDIPDRLAQRLGTTFCGRVTDVSASDGGVSCRLVVLEERRSPGRPQGFVIVNGRPVQARLVSAVLERFFSGPAGTPLSVAVISVPVSEVDFNVHPAKLEVRFRSPSSIEAAVARAAGAAVLDRRDSVASSMVAGFTSPSAPPSPETAGSGVMEAALELCMPVVQPGRPMPDPATVVQLGRSYLVSSVSGGMVVVDQHAAHERILYEMALHRLASGGTLPSQRLLLPEPVDLDPESAALLTAGAGILSAAGFDYEIEGERVVLNAIPAGARSGLAALSEALSVLGDPASAVMAPYERSAAAAACAAAVKFGEILDPAAAREMLDMLFATADPFHCPHGRPTIVEIPFEELERRFGR